MVGAACEDIRLWNVTGGLRGVQGNTWYRGLFVVVKVGGRSEGWSNLKGALSVAERGVVLSLLSVVYASCAERVTHVRGWQRLLIGKE